jgi:hypothetical protein
MTVVAFGKPKPDDPFGSEPDEATKKEMRKRHRVLRAYRRMAQQEHFCYNCNHYIEPGDTYTASVEVIGGKLVVWKYHDEPPCPVDPWEEEREIMREIDEEDKKKKRPKTKAA